MGEGTHFYGPLVVGAGKVESIVTTKSLDVEDNGKTLFLNLAGGFTTTLPVAATLSAGWQVRIVIGITPTTAYIVTENTASETDKLVGNVTTSTGHTTAGAFNATGFTLVTFVVTTGAVKGDYIDIIFDGTFFYVSGNSTVPAGITFT